MVGFNSDDHYIYYHGQESPRRNGVAIIVNKRVQNAEHGCNLKNNRMISVHFQGKPFNIMVIQDYARPVMLKRLKLNDHLELTPTCPPPKKNALFIIRERNAKLGSQKTPGVTGKFGHGVQNESG